MKLMYYFRFYYLFVYFYLWQTQVTVKQDIKHSVMVKQNINWWIWMLKD